MGSAKKKKKLNIYHMVMVPGATVSSRNKNELNLITTFKGLWRGKKKRLWLWARVGVTSVKSGGGVVEGRLGERKKEHTYSAQVLGPQGHREVSEMYKHLGEPFERFKLRHLQGGMHLRGAWLLR